MKQEEYDDPAKRPEIQDIILGGQIGCIAAVLSERLRISPTLALQMFLESNTCAKLHDKNTGLYFFSDQYIAEDFVRELQGGRG